MSRYPFIIRRLPAWSVIGVHPDVVRRPVTVAALAVPVSPFSASGVLLVAPVALFQFAFATTPAISAAPIAVPLPTKLMLTTPPHGARHDQRGRGGVTQDPLVPVMVSVELPAGVLAAVVTFSVAVPEPVTDGGVNEAVAFAGRPLTARLTAPANPFTAPTVTV